MNRRSRRRSSGGARRSRREEYYVDGNTVRKVAVKPARRRPAVKKNKEREAIPERPHRVISMSPGYVAFLLVALLVSATVCIWYVQLRSEITASQKKISSLNSTYTALKQENDEKYDRIIASVDLEAIKKEAMTEFGMKYPDEKQVVNISGRDDDYVRQYGDIPKKKKE